MYLGLQYISLDRVPPWSLGDGCSNLEFRDLCLPQRSANALNCVYVSIPSL